MNCRFCGDEIWWNKLAEMWVFGRPMVAWSGFCAYDDSFRKRHQPSVESVVYALSRLELKLR